MKKYFDFGKIAFDSTRKINKVTVKVELKEKDGKEVFSVSGDVWNSKGTDIVCGGQCLDSLVPYLKGNKTFMQIYRLWKLYHLNDMHAWCEHGDNTDASEKLKIYHLRYNEEGERLSRIRDLGKFKSLIEVTEEGLKNIPSALYEPRTYLGNKGVEEKTRGWVTYDRVFSPEGYIGKECPICKAKYGHAWYYRPIPQEDLQVIKDLIS